MKIITKAPICLPFLFLLGFLWSAAICYSRTQDYRQGQQEYRNLRTESVGREEIITREETTTREQNLKKYNPDYVFWLNIPNTAIDYPVVKSPDSDYYLSHTFQRQENSSGCLFIEPEDGEERENIVIYGHNRKDGSMFGTLKKYEAFQFYDSHPRLKIYYKGRWYQGEIFSCQLREQKELSCYQTVFKDRQDKETFLNRMKQESLYPIPIYPSSKDIVITLSTCRGSSKRVIVQAVLMCYTE